MAPLDKLKKKNAPTVSIALMRMKPMRRENMMSEDSSYDKPEDDMEEMPMREEAREESYEECPKCAKYQMLIGEALAYYMQHKEDSEEKPDTSEVEAEVESEMDSEKA
jgi:hypothetical protein